MGILYRSDRGPGGQGPDQDEEGNGYIVWGDRCDQGVIEDDALALLNPMKKMRKNR